MTVTVTTANQRAQLWYKELFADAKKITFFERFISTSPNSPIQEVSDLTAQPGDRINFGLSTRLGGTGIAGDSALEGSEAAISSYNQTVIVNQLRQGVLLTGRMDEQKVAYSMRNDAKEKLKIWWAERIDQECIDKLAGVTTSTFANTPDAPSAGTSVWAGGVSADGSLTAAMTMDTKVIDKAKQTAMLATVKVRPIRLEDEEYMGTAVYILIIHPWAAADLRKDPVWNQAQRDANVRGSDNPILSGALGIYNGVVVYEHELMYKDATGGSGGASIARGVLLGQQAAIVGYGSDDQWVEKSFDYGNQWGIAAGRIFGVQKTRFNSVDYGVVTIATGAAAASTA